MIEDFLLDLHVRNYSPDTLRSYGQTFSDLAGFAPGKLEELSSADLRQFLLSKGNMAPASRMRHIAALKSLARFMERRGSPCRFTSAAKAMQAPRALVRVPRALEQDQAALLVSAASRPRNTLAGWQVARMRAAVLLLYGAGLRSAELLALPFNVEGEVIRVVGKGRRERLVPLLPIVQQAIETYQQAVKTEDLNFDQLFGDMTGRDLRRMIEMLRRECGLPETTTPHALRHSFASHIYQNGGDIRVLADVMGHESVRTTALYAHGNIAHLMNVVQKCYPEKYKR
jgi:integrase/recombinase XerC